MSCVCARARACARVRVRVHVCVHVCVFVCAGMCVRGRVRAGAVRMPSGWDPRWVELGGRLGGLNWVGGLVVVRGRDQSARVCGQLNRWGLGGCALVCGQGARWADRHRFKFKTLVWRCPSSPSPPPKPKPQTPNPKTLDLSH